MRSEIPFCVIASLGQSRHKAEHRFEGTSTTQSDLGVEILRLDNSS